MLKYLFKTVPFDQIRHNDLPCYVDEGYGAKPIEFWPVYTFFHDYVKGEKERAYRNFEEWYFTQMKKYKGTSKKLGGMKNGSLYSLIEERSGMKIDEVDEETIKQIIHERVSQRFDLLESIMKSGYNPQMERVDAIKRGKEVYLTGGHHRAAILLALRYNEMPQVFVFPNAFLYKCFLFIRKLRRYVSF